jgi:prepilin-type N-terminal cleavage/methylation domain-containing protein
MRYRALRSVHGFSFIELLLVVALVAIIASVTLPALNGTMSSYRLRASADIIASELDAARVMAISRGAIYEVHFNGNQVAVIDPQESTDDKRAVRRPKMLEAGVTVSGPTITFRPRGSAVGGTIDLTNEKGITTSVTVQVSGKITVVQSIDDTSTQ